MAILAGLTIPAVSGIRSTYNRKSAIDIVMGTIEQARLAAIQSGENVYVFMALATDSGVSPDAIIVIGDPPIGSPAISEISYTHWIKLPPNERFLISAKTMVNSTSSIFPSQAPTGPATFLMNQTTLPPIGATAVSAYDISYFYFNSTGALVNPTSGGMELALFEGIRKGGTGSHGTQVALGPLAKSVNISAGTGLYEVIRLSQYTGRSWMDVSGL